MRAAEGRRPRASTPTSSRARPTDRRRPRRRHADQPALAAHQGARQARQAARAGDARQARARPLPDRVRLPQRRATARSSRSVRAAWLRAAYKIARSNPRVKPAAPVPARRPARRRALALGDPRPPRPPAGAVRGPRPRRRFARADESTHRASSSSEEESLVKTRAAMLRDTGRDWEIVELELDEPKQGEVLIRWVAAGLCHSDEHLRHGDIVPALPDRRRPRGRRHHREGRARASRASRRATTSSPRSCRSAATAAGAPPGTRTSATSARRSSTAACPTARSASTTTATTSARCACSAPSASTR